MVRMVRMVSQDRNAVMLTEKQERRRWKKYCESLDVGRSLGAVEECMIQEYDGKLERQWRKSYVLRGWIIVGRSMSV